MAAYSGIISSNLLLRPEKPVGPALEIGQAVVRQGDGRGRRQGLGPRQLRELRPGVDGDIRPRHDGPAGSLGQAAFDHGGVQSGRGLGHLADALAVRLLAPVAFVRAFDPVGGQGQLAREIGPAFAGRLEERGFAAPPRKGELDDGYAIAMAALPDDARRESGRLIGEQAAKAALAVGGIDPKIVQIPYRPKTTPGVWTATDLPQIRPHNVAFFPWAIASADALRSPPPPALTGARWAKDYEEVKRLGGKKSKDRTPHQSLMAQYRILPDLSPSLRRTADLPGRTAVQNARMYARVYMAIDDGVMAMSADKLFYDTWRPITAIRNGADDGNDATVPDPAWESFLPTPNFPEHPCGHCAYAGSVAEVMAAEDGPRPAGGVRVTSMSSPKAVVQILPSWGEWAQQVSDSRIYAGAHFRFANEAGEAVGRGAGKAVLDKVMRPLPQTKPR